MTAATSRPGNRYLANARRLFGSQEGILLLLLMLLIIGVGLYNPRFISEQNLTDVINANAYIAVAAIGISMIIITGNIDISVGAAIGVLVFIIRTWGGYPDAVAFAVLLMNIAAPTIDYYTQPRVFGHQRGS